MSEELVGQRIQIKRSDAAPSNMSGLFDGEFGYVKNTNKLYIGRGIGIEPVQVNVTENATTTTPGLMSAADKVKLNGLVDTGATKVTVSGSGSAITGASYDSTTRTITLNKDYQGYTHPAGNAANKASGLYKFSTNSTSHINSVTAVTKADITALGIPGSDTNTAHAHTAGTGLSISGSGGISGTTTYSLAESGVTAGTYGPTTAVTGSNGTTVDIPQITVDAYGRVTNVTNRTYTSKDSNTTYTAGSGLSLTNNKFNHSNSITAKTTYNQATASPGYGGKFKITEPKYDAQGHITGTQVAEITMPSAQTLSSLGITATATELNYTDGVTSNIQTQLNNINEELDAIDWFKKGTAIPDGSDLDTYNTPGKYYINAGASAATLTNCPITNDNFVLFVFARTSSNSTSLGQMIITLGSHIYLRNTSSNGAWRDWFKMAKYTEMTAYADSVGTAVKNELLNGAGDAYDTLKELADLINTNDDAIDALNELISGRTITAGAGLTGGGNLSNDVTIALDVSGVTANSYGPTAAVTGNNGTTINIPQITVDAYGRVTSATNRVYTSKDTTYSNATTTASGLMSAADKVKLNGIAEGADAVSYSQSVTSGTKIGAITIDGTATDIYVPNLSGGKAETADTSVVSGVTVSGHAVTVANKNISGNKGITTSGTADAITIGHSTTGGSDVANTAGKAVTQLTIDDYGHVTATGISDIINSITTTGTGNAITAASNSNGVITFTKGSNFKTVQSAVSSPTASGTAVSFIDTISQDTNGKITVTKKTVRTMSAASATAAGSTGLVPQPKAGDQSKYLRGDGTWESVLPTNATANYLLSADNNGIAYWKDPSTISVGNADYAQVASKLDHDYKINGTVFNNTQNITTSSWGTGRTIEIKDYDGTNAGSVLNADNTTSINGGQNIKIRLPSTIKATSFVGPLTGNVTGNVTGDVTGDLNGLAKNATNVRITLTDPTSATSYYPTWVSGTTAGTNYALRGNNGCKYMTLEGVAGTAGYGYLILGNNVALENAGNKYGGLRLFGTGTTYTNLRTYQPETSRTVYLRDYGATAYLAATTSTSAIGSAAKPVYVNSKGVLTACTTPDTENWWGAVVTNTTAGNTHVGKAIRFHLTDTSTESYEFQLTCESSGVLKSSGKVYGAVWNDYAEFRKYKDGDQIPYGRVVIENGDDSLSLSTQRMQKGGNICSDTFGFAIGETEEAQMPIAISGRVLVYTNEDRNSYEPGDAVCTGPNGTISKMTREEIKEYPDCIIGYVSAVPQYDIWGEENIKVDNRIWIKVV